MEKLNILLINKFLYQKGGSETYLFNIGNYLKNQGHNVEYFGMQHKENIVTNSLNEEVSNVEFRGSYFSKILYPLKIIYSIEAKKKIRKIINITKPDIIHLNNYNFQITPSILYEIKKYNIPVVMTLHDFQLVCPNHMLYLEHEKRICEECKGRKYLNCVKNKCIHNSRVKSIFGAIEGLLYYKLGTYEKYIDYFIAPSRFIKNKMAEFGEDNSKIRVIHNFVTENQATVTSQKGDYILYFGRMSTQKGIHTLIEACKRLPNIKFVFAGGGELQNELSGIKNINFVGFKKNDELKTLIEEALFSVCTSECYDNCPMSILESQMYKTPVIGASIGGIPELIDEGIDGLLYEAGNVNDLIQKITYLYENRDVLRDFSTRCEEKVKERFSMDNYYFKLIEVYNIALQKHQQMHKQYRKGMVKNYE